MWTDVTWRTLLGFTDCRLESTACCYMLSLLIFLICVVKYREQTIKITISWQIINLISTRDLYWQRKYALICLYFDCSQPRELPALQDYKHARDASCQTIRDIQSWSSNRPARISRDVIRAHGDPARRRPGWGWRWHHGLNYLSSVYI